MATVIRDDKLAELLDDVIRLGLDEDGDRDPSRLHHVRPVRDLAYAIDDLQREKESAEADVARLERQLEKLRDAIYGLDGCMGALKAAIAEPGPDGLFREWVLRDAREIVADAEIALSKFGMD